VKQLIVNADDFGADPAVNAAVARAYTEGILTSASLLITAPYADEAVAFARQHPRLSVGLHACLVSGRAATADLADTHGNLPKNLFRFGAKLMVQRRVAEAVERELRAQLQQFLATGLKPTHLDTHQHTHIHPVVLRIVVGLAREYSIPYVRAAFEPFWPAVQCERQRLVRKLARWMVFSTLGARSRRQLRQMGLMGTERCVGVLDPGHLNEEFLLSYLPDLQEGVTEIFFHPAVETPESLRLCPPGYERAEELRALCSPQVRQSMEALGIRLTNFRELAEKSNT
jgi:hopanoid biosynthesis associated protein HpnK